MSKRSIVTLLSDGDSSSSTTELTKRTKLDGECNQEQEVDDNNAGDSIKASQEAEWCIIPIEVFQQQIYSFLTAKELISTIALLNRAHHDLIMNSASWLHAKIFISSYEMRQLIENNVWDKCQFKNISIVLCNPLPEPVERELMNMSGMVDLELKLHQTTLSSFGQLLTNSAQTLKNLTLLSSTYLHENGTGSFELDRPLNVLSYLRVSRQCLKEFRTVLDSDASPQCNYHILRTIVSRAPHLKVLSFSTEAVCATLDAAFAETLWTSCPLLEEFHVHNAKDVQDSFFSHMHNCKNLKVLSLYLCPKLTRPGVMNHLNHANILASLRELNVRLQTSRAYRFGDPGAYAHVTSVRLEKKGNGFKKLHTLLVDALFYQLLLDNHLLPKKQTTHVNPVSVFVM